MFIISLKYKVKLEKVLIERPSHVEFLDKYYSLGKILMSGRKYDTSGGVIIVNSKDESEVLKIAKEDPFYIKGIADFEIIGFDVTKCCKQIGEILY